MSVKRLSWPWIALIACLLAACVAPADEALMRTPLTPPSDETTADIPAQGLDGMTWYWLGVLTPARSSKTPNPSLYRLEFKPDGWFEVHTECGSGRGLYETFQDRIALAVVDSPGTGCATLESVKNYLDNLQAVGTYHVTADRLYLHLTREAKSLVFQRHP